MASKEIGMEKSIAFIREQALGGNYQQAAARAAGLRASKGDQPEAAMRLAAQAASADSEKLLALALALCPSARAQSAERFLSALGIKAAAWCARRDPELACAAMRLEKRRSEAAIEAGAPKAAQAGKGKGGKRGTEPRSPAPAVRIVRRCALPKGWARRAASLK